MPVERRTAAHWWRTPELETLRDAMIEAIRARPKHSKYPGQEKFWAAETAIDAYVAACVAAEAAE